MSHTKKNISFTELNYIKKKYMKNILLLVSSTLLLASNMIAQDANDKKVRFGLKVCGTPTWLRSTDVNTVNSSGVKFGAGFGLQIEFRINSTSSFVTGIGGDLLGGKQVYKKGQGYILTKDNGYTDSKNTDFSAGTVGLSNSMDANGNKFYEINSRTVKTNYVTIPVLLKLMTKDISSFKYFGIFGGNIAVQTKFSANDDISELKYNSTTTQYETSSTSIVITDKRPTGDLIPINIGLNVGMGFEYNLSGSTSVFFSVNYLRGFINQYQSKSQLMVDKLKENLNATPISTKPVDSKQSAFCDGVQINVGILF
jgi:opacity protein-like surface antigen